MTIRIMTEDEALKMLADYPPGHPRHEVIAALVKSYVSMRREVARLEQQLARARSILGEKP